ncbi:ABC transporter permease [Vibrio mexicanus]|uniref:ABC transporter permease n=1 Tax=Vibrio mexicanus TaxID=1004326 RepID=UPI00063C1DEC|nr:ABC transporter permease [Vibrio mexicanus]
MSENAVKTQLSIVKRDIWLLSSLTWVPVALALTIWWIFSQGIATNLPIGVVDLDQSQLSRSFTRHLEATPTLAITQQYSSAAEAKRDLTKSDIYAYVVIPHEFDKQVRLGRSPQVSVFYNSQYILVGKLINSAVMQAQGTLNTKLAMGNNLGQGNSTLSAALGKALPIQTQITALFNLNSNYAQFLVGAIIPAIWQIGIIVTGIMTLSANNRERGVHQWLNRQPFLNVIRTLLPYLPLYLLQGIGFLWLFYGVLNWPMQGSLLIIAIAQVVTVVCCLIMATLFYFLSLDAARAMSFAGAFTAPSFAFMGITFPVSDMNSLAQFWRSLLPISHYIEMQVGQASYGASIWHSLNQLTPMIGYLIPALACGYLIKRATQNTANTETN